MNRNNTVRFPSNQRPRTPFHPASQPGQDRQKLTGHEVILASAHKNGREMNFKLNDGDTLTGHVSQFDKWTVTIRLSENNHPVTLYKHAIQYFTPTESVGV